MRISGFAVVLLTAVGSLALAQQPVPPAQPVNPAQPLNPANPLDAALLKWEQVMSTIISLRAKCERRTVNKVFQNVEDYVGEAKYLKVQQLMDVIENGQKVQKPQFFSLASLEMQDKKNPQSFEKYLSTGAALFEFVPSQKVIRIHELPKPLQGQIADDNLLSFLFGMKAAQAKQRYQLTWVPPPANDNFYHYIDIRPVAAADKADFARARLVLIKQSGLPRQIWYEAPNGNEITWDLPQMETNIQIPPGAFDNPKLPEGWQWVRPPAAQVPPAPPRVARPQQ